MILDDDKQTLLCLSITLPERYQYLTKIWELTPGITADRAKNMLLEEERRTKSSQAQANIDLVGRAFTAVRSLDKRTPSRRALEAANKGPCPKCGKDHSEAFYWRVHPKQAPE